MLVDVNLEKATNGEDADDPTGPLIPVGQTAAFTYVLTSNSNVAVAVALQDNNGTTDEDLDDFNPNFVGGDDNDNGLLDPDETWTYAASRTVTPGQYTNIANVSAIHASGAGDIEIDPSNHFGVVVDVNLQKATNGEDADDPTGPLIEVGQTAAFTYVLTSNSNVPVAVALQDDNGTTDDDLDDFNPNFVGGDDNDNGLLDPDETWTYAASRTVTPGQYTNIANVSAIHVASGAGDIEIDPSNHFGVAGGIVIGNDKGTESRPLVTVLDPDTGEEFAQFLAYEESYRGGVRVAIADMDGDGFFEIITAPGKSHVPEIRVFSRESLIDPGSWVERTEFRTLAYATDFGGGVNIAVADVDGDGRNDIVTTPSRGAAETKVFRNLFGIGDDPILDIPVRQFFAFGPDFINGSVVSAIDMNLDGLADVVVGNAGGMRSTVLVYDVSGTPEIINSYFPFSEGFRGGVSIDLGEINAGDIPDLVVGASYRGRSRVEVLDGASGDLLTGFTAYINPISNAPVRVVVEDDGVIDRIITAQGPNGETNEIRSFKLIFVDDDLVADPEPLETIDLNELNDPFLIGAYYIDARLLDIGVANPVDGPTDGPEGERVRQDVNDDGNVSPLDALTVINYLGQESIGEGERGSAASQGHHLDVNGDDRVTPLDALQVINYLSQNRLGAAEGEFAQVRPPAALAKPDATAGAADAVFAGLADEEEDKHDSVALPANQSAVESVSMIDPVSSAEANQDDDEEVLDLLVNDLLFHQN